MDQAVYRRMRAAKAIADDPRCDPGTRQAALNRYDAMAAKYGDPFAKASAAPHSGGFANRENFGGRPGESGPEFVWPHSMDGRERPEHWNCRSTVHPDAEAKARAWDDARRAQADAAEARAKERWHPEREHWTGEHPNFKRKTRERERMEEEMRRAKERGGSDAADAFAYAAAGMGRERTTHRTYTPGDIPPGMTGNRAEYVFVDDPDRPGTKKAQPSGGGWANGYEYHQSFTVDPPYESDAALRAKMRDAADKIYGRHAPGARKQFEADFLAEIARMARERYTHDINATLDRGRKCGRALIWLRDHLACDVDIIGGEPYTIMKAGTKIGGPFSQQGVINFAHLQGWDGK